MRVDCQGWVDVMSSRAFGAALKLLGEFGLAAARLRRHALETVLSTVFLMMVMIALVSGFEWAGEMSSLPRPEGVAVGFVVWRFAMSAYASTAVEVAQDIQFGCLEQLAVGQGLLSTYLFRSVTHILLGSSAMLLMWCAASFAISGLPAVSIGALLGIVWLGAPALVGMGLFVGAANLSFRQSDTINSVLLLCVVVLVSLPGVPFSGTSLLPFVYAASLARALVEDGNPTVFAWLANGLISAGWLLLGCLAFWGAVRRAKRLGTLAHR